MRVQFRSAAQRSATRVEMHYILILSQQCVFGLNCLYAYAACCFVLTCLVKSACKVLANAMVLLVYMLLYALLLHIQVS
jgi:hypothetical protein